MSLAAMMDLASMGVERADHVGLRLGGRLISRPGPDGPRPRP